MAKPVIFPKPKPNKFVSFINDALFSVTDEPIRRLFKVLLPLCFVVCALIYVFLDHKYSHDKTETKPAFIDFSKEFLIAICATIFTATLTYWLYPHFFKESLEKERSALAELLARKVSHGRMHGIQMLHRSLDQETIGNRIRSYSATFILETWIDTFTLDQLKDSFKEAFDKGNQITICLLHPNSMLVHRRGIEMYPDGGYNARSAIVETITRLKALRSEWINERVTKGISSPTDQATTNLRVFCYDSLPAVQLYMWSESAFAGLYLRGISSSQGHQFEIDCSEGIGKHLVSHLHALLQDAERADTSFFMEVDFSKDIKSQFQNVHLPCQLHEIREQLINLSVLEMKKLAAELIVSSSRSPNRAKDRYSRLAQFANELKKSIPKK